MRFDYFGTRDSAGETYHGDPSRWRADILAARSELMARTGATSIVGIGVRLGGTLLANTLDEVGWARVVYWDAFRDGNSFLQSAEAAEAQRQRASMPQFVRARRARRGEAHELHGFAWSTRALAQVRGLRMETPEHALTTNLWADHTKLLEQMPDTFVVQSLMALAEPAL